MKRRHFAKEQTPGHSDVSAIYICTRSVGNCALESTPVGEPVSAEPRVEQCNVLIGVARKIGHIMPAVMQRSSVRRSAI